MRLLNRNVYNLVRGRKIGKFEGKDVYYNDFLTIDDTTCRIYATFDRQDLLNPPPPKQAFWFDVEVKRIKCDAKIVFVPDFIHKEVW